MDESTYAVSKLWLIRPPLFLLIWGGILHFAIAGGMLGSYGVLVPFLAVVLYLFIGIFLISCVIGWFNFRVTIGPQAVNIQQGHFFRSQRSIDYAEIRSVKLVRPFLDYCCGRYTVKIQLKKSRQADFFWVQLIEENLCLGLQHGILRIPCLTRQSAEDLQNVILSCLTTSQ